MLLTGMHFVGGEIKSFLIIGKLHILHFEGAAGQLFFGAVGNVVSLQMAVATPFRLVPKRMIIYPVIFTVSTKNPRPANPGFIPLAVNRF